MIGIDTNVLLRTIVADDPRQAEVAIAFLEKHCTPESPGFVNSIVLCELVWSLRSTYGVGRKDIAVAIGSVLNNSSLALEDRTEVMAAVQKFRAGATDFPDLLISEINRSCGCSATATFDRKAAKLEGFIAVR